MRDYRGETGIIGKWKGFEVYVLTKEQYMDLTYKKDFTVYVISNDDNKMVLREQVIGNLMLETGTVIENRQGEYVPVRTMEIPQKETVGEYDQYASIVNEFFKNLKDPVV